MQEQEHAGSIPWTARDVWLGLGILGLWLVVSIGFSLLVYFYSLDLDPGLVISIMELVLLGPVWWLTVRKYEVRWKALGLRGFRGETVGLGCALMVLFYTFNCFYNAFLALLGLNAYGDLVAVFGEASSPWLLMVGGVVVAPVAEEVFFRGFVFSGLRQRYGWQKAAMISSVAFAVLHLRPAAVIPIFILGYIFAYLYHRSESVWPAVLMHITVNTLGLLAVYMLAKMNLPQSGL